MALLSVIRRWHLREGMPIRESTRRTGLSRNTVRKYLASGVVEPRYHRRKSPSKLDDYEHTLISWLFRESKRHRKQRRSVRQLHGDLVQRGYSGSYDRVAAFARQWRQEQQETRGKAGQGTFVPLQFALGEAFQFDWSEDYAVINATRTKLQIVHFKFSYSYSRAFILRAYLLQSHEMLFDAHCHVFSAVGGVPERGIYDNMKTAVDKVGRGKKRLVNKRFQAMVSHYLFEAKFCNPAAGWEKGQMVSKRGRRELILLNDLHIEFEDFEPPETNADVVVLAGDVGVGMEGLRWAVVRFPGRPVIYVPGNHEFYHHDIALIDELKTKAQENIHVLNDDQVIIDGVRFLGSILWTDFALFGEADKFFAMQQAQQQMTDFSIIQNNGQCFTPEDVIRLHTTSRDWLAAMLAEPFDGKTVVVTHHAPSSQSVHPRYANDLLTPAFASNLENLMDGDRAALWVHGHMHESYDYEIYGTRVVCNPRGYAPNALNPDFRPDWVIEV